MANHHLRNKTLSLKAKGLLSLMLSLPEDWDYTTRGLSCICKDGVDSIRVRQLCAFSLSQWHECKAYINFHSSASAPDSHRLPLFSPLLTGHKTYLISGKRKSHTGRLLPALSEISENDIVVSLVPSACHCR